MREKRLCLRRVFNIFDFIWVREVFDDFQLIFVIFSFLASRFISFLSCLLQQRAFNCFLADQSRPFRMDSSWRMCAKKKDMKEIRNTLCHRKNRKTTAFAPSIILTAVLRNRAGEWFWSRTGIMHDADAQSGAYDGGITNNQNMSTSILVFRSTPASQPPQQYSLYL